MSATMRDRPRVQAPDGVEDTGLRLATFDRTRPGGKPEELRLSIAEFKGRRFISVRVWFIGTDGRMYPGKHGISIRRAELEDWSLALSEAADQLADDPTSGHRPQPPASRSRPDPRPYDPRPRLAEHGDRDRPPWEPDAPASASPDEDLPY